MSGFIEVVIVICLVFTGLGGLCKLVDNENIRKQNCRIELATQTKLDTANILLLCNGAK